MTGAFLSLLQLQINLAPHPARPCQAFPAPARWTQIHHAAGEDLAGSAQAVATRRDASKEIPMAITQDRAESLDARRRKHVLRSGFAQVISSWTDPESGAGFVLTRNVLRKKDIAYFFKPRTVNRCFLERPVETAHERLALASTLRKLMDDQKAAKVAPHDLKVGEIIVRIWGVTMRGADFYRVTSIPHPRSVRMAPIPHVHHSGDWMAGEVVPDESVWPDDAAAEEYKVTMQSGEAEIVPSSSIERIRRWSGKPVMIFSD